MVHVISPVMIRHRALIPEPAARSKQRAARKFPAGIRENVRKFPATVPAAGNFARARRAHDQAGFYGRCPRVKPCLSPIHRITRWQRPQILLERQPR